MNTTIEMLRILGSPFAEHVTLEKADFKKLYTYARKNRMSFFFLENTKGKLPKTETLLYEKEKTRFVKINKAIIKLSDILAAADVHYAFFKTIRPYKSATVDLDVLVFDNYSNVLKMLSKAGYILLAQGPRSTTFIDPEANIGIDIYDEIATSFIIYLDKQSLIEYVTIKHFPGGTKARVLSPEADLACIIAHSMIKEQIYTLSEYFSFIYYLRELNIQNFLELTKQNKIVNATRVHATLTALLHKIAHGTVPHKLQKILTHLREDNFESAYMTRKRFATPHKYHPITIAKSLIEIAKGRKTRQSIATQLFNMINPRISTDFLRKLLNHIIRETY